jgi:hypothetical protein
LITAYLLFQPKESKTKTEIKKNDIITAPVEQQIIQPNTDAVEKDMEEPRATTPTTIKSEQNEIIPAARTEAIPMLEKSSIPLDSLKKEPAMTIRKTLNDSIKKEEKKKKEMKIIKLKTGL